MDIRKIIKYILLIIYACFGVLSLSLLFIERHLFETWSELLPDEIIYHLKAPLEGTDTTVITKWFSTYGIIVLIITASLAFIHYLLKDNKKAFIKLVSLCLVTCLCFIGTGLFDLNDKTGVFSYIAVNRSYDPEQDFVSQTYVNPSDVRIIFPEEKRNLIYIFLESVEVTYMDRADGGYFDENIIPELTELAKENGSFEGDSGKVNGAYSPPGTNWTIGAMFAQTSGLPLKLTLNGNYMTHEDNFFPGITTIGNILEEEGYHNTLLIGSDAVFGGRKALFTDHGKYDIHDYYYMIDEGKIDEDYKVWWGYEDEKLFEFAKEDLLNLAKEDAPFNYTMLTVDTHFEDGYVCRLCKKEHGDNQYANVFSCSSRQVADFVSWIKEQDFYENTTVVIAGDHTTMDRDFCTHAEEDKSYNRKAYFTILNSAAQADDEMKEREYSVLDAFPTTLAAMGCRIQDNMLGLGTNLYSSKPTLVEELGYDEMCKQLEMPSHFFDDYDINGLRDAELELIKERVSLAWFQKNGKYNIIVEAVNSILNPTELQDGYIILTFPDGRKERYECTLDYTNKYDPNGFFYYAITDLEPEDIIGAYGEAYCTIRDHKNMLMCANELNEDNLH